MAFGRQLHQVSANFAPAQASANFAQQPKLSANFAQQPKQVRISHHQPAMQVQISHQPMRLWCEISSVLPTPH